MFVTGDTHGMIDIEKIDTFYDIIKTLDDKLPFNREAPEFVMIAGDFGFIWKSLWESKSKHGKATPTIAPDDLKRIENVFNYYPWTTLWIDGNHENFDVLDNLPTEERWGGKVSVITEKCIMLRRGEVYTINGVTFLAMGGALSVDKYRRVKGQSWWPQETISDQDYNNAVVNLAKVQNKVDFVLSHTCPTSALKVLEARLPKYQVDLWGPKADDVSCDKLEALKNIITTKHWVFGHFHVDETFVLDGITFRAKFESFWDCYATISKEKEGEGLANDKQKLLLSLYDMEFN